MKLLKPKLFKESFVVGEADRNDLIINRDRRNTKSSVTILSTDIILDSGCTHHMVKNVNLLTKVLMNYTRDIINLRTVNNGLWRSMTIWESTVCFGVIALYAISDNAWGSMILTILH